MSVRFAGYAAQSTAELAETVRRAAAPGMAEVLLLTFTPTVLAANMPELFRANMPLGLAWPAFDGLLVEDYETRRHAFRFLLEVRGYEVLEAASGQEDQQHRLGVVRRDPLHDRLEQHRLSGPRRGDDESPLPLAEGGDQVNHPVGQAARRPRSGGALEHELIVRIRRGERAEGRSLADRLRRETVDGADRLQR